MLRCSRSRSPKLAKVATSSSCDEHWEDSQEMSTDWVVQNALSKIVFVAMMDGLAWNRQGGEDVGLQLKRVDQALRSVSAETSRTVCESISETQGVVSQ